MTPAQLAIAWVMSRGDDIVPVIGAGTRKQLSESLAAADLTLSDDEIATLERAVKAEEVAGTRHDPAQMRALDSER